MRMAYTKPVCYTYIPDGNPYFPYRIRCLVTIGQWPGGWLRVGRFPSKSCAGVETRVRLFSEEIKSSPTTRINHEYPKVERKDAIFSIGRIAWLVLALQSGNVNNLRAGCEDKMHQPQRARQDAYKHVSTSTCSSKRVPTLHLQHLVNAQLPSQSFSAE